MKDESSNKQKNVEVEVVEVVGNLAILVEPWQLDAYRSISSRLISAGLSEAIVNGLSVMDFPSRCKNLDLETWLRSAAFIIWKLRGREPHF